MATLVPLLVLAMLIAAGQADAQADGGAKPATRPAGVYVSGLFPAGGQRPASDPEGKKYDNDPQAIASGKVLFGAMNCSGCHSHGGGGMGLALMSGNWHYGGRIEQIYASISQGRPNGMPTWGQALSPDMIWQLAAYVKSLPTSGSFSLEAAPNP